MPILYRAMLVTFCWILVVFDYLLLFYFSVVRRLEDFRSGRCHIRLYNSRDHYFNEKTKLQTSIMKYKFVEQCFSSTMHA